MKVKIIMVLGIILILTSCSYSSPDMVRFNGNEYKLKSDDSNGRLYSREFGSISAGESYDLIIREKDDRIIIIYNYKEYIINGDKNNFSVIYPNKVEISSSFKQGVITVSGDVTKILDYPPINEFRFFLSSEGGRFDGSQLLFGIVLFILGVVSIVSPETTWFLNRGWMYKKAEPSELYLTLVKIGGVIGCIAGIIFLFSSCSSS
ncbi:DUF6199 family natural product biosynthesis protein [Vallitalea maricola]|uniref:Uncharacterized protein n=1 Tax=Vallitalea maricola TaxID=3074433 RepID=A0ACB5UQ12_9FIRM|nr:hypothetical protein AN2V17_38660 [Vallitalea sp. AN17-2]